jgi:hypothetical protein
MENRAAVFTSQPQAVEVYQAGAWWAGELLGWRHDADGSCQVWVRVVLGGIEETAWTDLATLRLPERHLAVAAEPSSRYVPATQEMSVARHPAGRRARPADADAAITAGLPVVRDLTVVPDRPSAQLPTGRRRAPEESSAGSAGGRRRAPEDLQQATSAARPGAPEAVTAERPAVPPSPGRHRAPAADLGRHRTADTGLAPVLSAVQAPAGLEDSTGGPRWTPPAARGPRPGDKVERARDGWAAPDGLEPDLLTRPMRLSDQMPHSRRPRVDGSLRGV